MPRDRPPAGAVAVRPGPRRAGGADAGGARLASCRSPARGPWPPWSSALGRPRARRPGCPPGPCPGAGGGRGPDVADARRRIPGVDVSVELDEPALPVVLAGVGFPHGVGFHRHRHVPERRRRGAGRHGCGVGRATPLVHPSARPTCRSTCSVERAPARCRWTCSARRRRARPARRGAGGRDRRRWASYPRSTRTPRPQAHAVTERVLRWLDMLGLDPADVGERAPSPPAVASPPPRPPGPVRRWPWSARPPAT